MVPEIISGKRTPRSANASNAGEDRRLGVQRVENGLDEDEVGAAVDEPSDLLAVGEAQFIEGHRAEAGIVDIRRKGRGAVGRSQCAGDEPAPAVGPFRLDCGAPRQSRPVAIELVDDILSAVVGLRDRGRGEGVGFENIRAGQRVGEMDLFDRAGLRQRQKIIVALQMALAALKAIAPEMRLIETQALDLGAHRSVEH